ncbi:aldose epimerase family protein [Pareuzebyella sediminis]|uniref:aldose epimerase family protein n=1 Tax=Pareuzebyella sediminis TaxID=2607998 RepID=UPI0011EBD332|nr:aldose 1-epimerase [Pareuzebyella sediminis]
MLTLNYQNQSVKIDGGELIGYKVSGHEYIHQKGSAGWRNSDTEMFPIIGPTAAAGFQVQTPRDIAVQDQHGLLRELDYELLSKSETSATYRKTYKAGAPVTNSKYPEKSNKKFLFFTYDFEFRKHFEISENGLEITFIVSGERDMPFMLGYHPAFKIYTNSPIIVAHSKEISLAEILSAGSRALEVPDCQEILLKDLKELHIRTEGFGHFMLWTEVSNMLCIEPISFYPYSVAQSNLHEGFRYLKDSDEVFRVFLDPQLKELS